MKRVVKKHDVRKNELINVAQNMFYRKGYEHTSVAAIIDAVGIAKGTFYHYFKSKEDLLDQIIKRQADIIDQIINRVANDTDINAVEKINRVFSLISQYKAEEKEVMIMVSKALHKDENLILRDKMVKSRIKTVAPKLAEIINQGISERMFNTGPAEHIAEILLYLPIHVWDDIARAFQNREPNHEMKNTIIKKYNTCENAMARILGVQEGAIKIVDSPVIEMFFEEYYVYNHIHDLK